MHFVVVVDKPDEWSFLKKQVAVISAKEYLTKTELLNYPTVRITNLCRNQKYQSIGYYVSLIAKARGHKVSPSVSNMQDMNSTSLLKVIAEEINELMQRDLAHIKSDEFVLSIYFGKNISPHYDKLCKKILSLFQAPLMRAYFIFDKQWKLKTLKSISIADIPETHQPYLEQFATEYFNKKRFIESHKKASLYNLAILINPKEQVPPSNQKALEKFSSVAEILGFDVEFITKDDFNRLSEFDALFIRETTSVNHHTYRFARRAISEGLVVIDDPESILRCANKVYLTELLQRARIDIPKSIVLLKSSNLDKIEEQFGFPCVLKIPDGAFSKGVKKINDRQELELVAKEWFMESDLILAQEFSPSEFDWRIGIIDKKFLFASKYYMAKGHWQVVNWNQEGICDKYGDDEAVPEEEVPEKVIKTALRAANLIGDGFYGVDLKQVGSRVMVIEVNDNPSIDAGVEDKILGDKLYHEVMKTILQRVHIKKSEGMPKL